MIMDISDTREHRTIYSRIRIVRIERHQFHSLSLCIAMRDKRLALFAVKTKHRFADEEVIPAGTRDSRPGIQAPDNQLRG